MWKEVLQDKIGFPKNFRKSFKMVTSSSIVMHIKPYCCSVHFLHIFVRLWVIQLFFTDLALSVCRPNLPTKIVAEMCRDSVAEGELVFIDTKHAIRTDNGTGVLCQCSVTFSNQTSKVKIQVTNSRENCGSSLSLNFTSDGDFYTTDQPTCSLSVISKVTDYAEIDLRKTNQPFGVQYCAEMNLRVCADDEFQCNDGQCIDKHSRCDDFTDCSDHSDELHCSSGSACAEGKEYCDILKQCVEPLKCVANSSVSVSKENDPLRPVIRVECMESLRFSTTTTTTTTSTTTTTTPSTTTTTPTTTTASTTTTTTPTTIPAVTTATDKVTTEEPNSPVTIGNTLTETTDGPSTHVRRSSRSTESIETEISTSTPFERSSVSTVSSSEPINGPLTSTEKEIPGVGGSVDVSHNDEVDPLRKPGVIAAIVIGTIIGICLLVMIVWYIAKSRKKNEYQPPDLWIPTDNNKEMEPLNS